MPMGFKNSPLIFQRIMDNILKDLINKGVQVYLDDIVIYSKTREEHDKLLNEVFRRLRDNNLVVNEKKMQLEQEEVNFLGYEVSGKGIKIAETKKRDILEYPRPTGKKALRRFLGKMNFYSGFLPNLRTIAAPLYELTGTKGKFEWNDEREQAFIKLKELLSKETTVIHPDYNK